MTFIILSDNGSPLQMKRLREIESFKVEIQLNKSEFLLKCPEVIHIFPTIKFNIFFYS